MSQNEDQLIAQMRALLPTSGYHWVERVSEEDVAQAEAKLGFPLPSLLKRIYLEVGNGAFGFSPLDGEGLNGMDEEGLVDDYLQRRSLSQEDIDLNWEQHEEKPFLWPEKLLPIYDSGCNIYSCIDCSHPENRVLRYDPNISFASCAIEAPSLQQWLEAILDGTFNFQWSIAEKLTF
jgi:SMI1 / KNR4 family (SUKH-1)